MSVAAWQSAEAECHDAKADELDITIDRLESHWFLERDLARDDWHTILKTLGILKAKRNDHRADADKLRQA